MTARAKVQGMARSTSCKSLRLGRKRWFEQAFLVQGSTAATAASAAVAATFTAVATTAACSTATVPTAPTATSTTATLPTAAANAYFAIV